MENRVLLAFLLSLAVFFGWSYFMSVIQPPPAKKAVVEKRKKEVSKDSGQPAAPGLAGLPPASEVETPSATPLDLSQAPFPGNEVKVHVTNDFITYVISSKGATLHDVLLNKYQDKDGNPINLINHANGGQWPLSIESGDDAVDRILQNAYYETSVSSLQVSEVVPEGKLTLRLNHSSGLVVVREFTFHYGKFLIDIQTRVSAPQWANKNLQYKVFFGPGLGGKVKSQTDHFVFSGATTFVNDARVETPADEVVDTVSYKGDLKWTSFQNKYFAAALIPGSGTKSAIVKKVQDKMYVGLEFESVQSATSASHALYIGTKDMDFLEESGHKLVRLMDYGWFGNKFAFLVHPLLKGLKFFYAWTGNYGWAIIILTFLIKLVFFPLTHKSFKSMKGMQKVQPYVKVIQERNKGDRQKMNEEMLELYKKHKVNPLGGCLPMLLQIPVFIALYHALFFSIELRGAPFMFWIQDLSERDPYYVTPVIMGATMYLQQLMSPAIGDPIQQKIMRFLPVIFTFLFISFPAGLVIYWTMNNILTISQQYYIYKIAKD